MGQATRKLSGNSLAARVERQRGASLGAQMADYYGAQVDVPSFATATLVAAAEEDEAHKRAQE